MRALVLSAEPTQGAPPGVNFTRDSIQANISVESDSRDRNFGGALPMISGFFLTGALVMVVIVTVGLILLVRLLSDQRKR
jgi:hypothetical protein